MAITGTALQGQLGNDVHSPRVMKEFPTGGSNQYWYVSGGVKYPGRVRLIETTAADSASAQATTVENALAA